MGSPERTIMNRLKTVIAGITTDGGYNYDLSGDDQVLIGGTFLPSRLPSVYLFGEDTNSSIQAGRTALNSYQRQQLVRIEMWVGHNSTDPAEIHLAPFDAQHDLMKAIELDPTLDGNVDSVIMNAQRSSAVRDMPGVAVAVVTLTIAYREVRGA